MYFHGSFRPLTASTNFHGGSRFTFESMEVSVKVGGSRWEEVDGSFHGSRWKLLHLLPPRKLPSISVETSICFRGSRSTSIYFLHRSTTISIYIHPWRLPATYFAIPSTSMEASTNFHGGGRSTSSLFGSRPAAMEVAPASMEATTYIHMLPSTQ